MPRQVRTAFLGAFALLPKPLHAGSGGLKLLLQIAAARKADSPIVSCPLPAAAAICWGIYETCKKLLGGTQ
jgi:hypothetical protein